MDKNNCDNNSYFYERNYYKDVPIKDTQILECKFCSNGTPILKSAVHSF